MKKFFLLLAIFATIPASISCMDETGDRGYFSAPTIIAGAAVVFVVGSGVILYRHYTDESFLKNPETTPSNSQPQESRNVVLKEYVKQKDKEQKELLAALINAGESVPSASSEEPKEKPQKQTVLVKEKLQPTKAPQPEVKITPVSETNKPSIISTEKQSNRDHIGDIFAEHLTIIMG